MQRYFHSNPHIGMLALLGVVSLFIYLLINASAVAQCIGALDCMNLP